MTRRAFVAVVTAALLLAPAESALADKKAYAAERFDSRIRVDRGGTLQVTETVVFNFQGGPFSQVSRDIPSRRTDGIEIVSASMDGVIMPPGSHPGQIEISGDSRRRVRWHFLPVSDASRTFELTYLVHGGVRQEEGADAILFRALPSEHAYRIASATIDLELPQTPTAPPQVEQRRVASTTVELEGTHVRIAGQSIRSNGWLEARIRLPRGSVIEAPPQWQQRQFRADSLSRVWLTSAAVVLIAGLILLFAIRQGYDSPPGDYTSDNLASARVPDTLSPAIAGALIANGSVRLEHAMATLFSLADRGELAIVEAPRSMGQHHFALSRTTARRPLGGHEQVVLDLVFTGRHGLEDTVDLGKARGRLARHFKRFSSAVTAEMAAAGLLDEGRKEVRTRYLRVGLIAVVLGVVAFAALAIRIDDYGAWSMWVPVAFIVVAVSAFICSAAHTPLSNDAVRRATHWRSFQSYLKDFVQDRVTSLPAPATRLLPFAVAVGLAASWAKHLKQHGEHVPPWFRALTATESGHAFSALVAHGGASHASGGGSGSSAGGSAAGGGASSAS